MKIAGFNHVSCFALARMAAAFGLASAVSLVPVPAGAQGTPEQQQACQPDAMRLCSEFIPDVERIIACMTKNRLRLSPACRAVFSTPSHGRPRHFKPRSTQRP